MRRVMFWIGLFWLAGSSFGQTICPKHIEMPSYPAVAQVARVQGKITLKVTIDTDGKVKDVEVIEAGRAHGPNSLLQESAAKNMQLWTFEKPQSAPATQLIVYEYKFDGSLPVHNHLITKVSLDLPDHVTIISNELFYNPGRSKNKKPSSQVP